MLQQRIDVVGVVNDIVPIITTPICNLFWEKPAKDIYQKVIKVIVLIRKHLTIKKAVETIKRAFVKRYLTSLVDCQYMRCLLNIPKPRLAFKKEFFYGGTGYIDGIRKQDVAHGICHGRDCYGRFFITIKYKCLTTHFPFDGSLVSPNPEKEYNNIWRGMYDVVRNFRRLAKS